MVLNLGHTFAHAIEQAAGHGVIPHGVAVAAGCGVALEAAAAAGLLQDAALPERIRALSRDLGLPADELIAAMRHDKKSVAGAPRFVLPRAAGDLALDVELDPTPHLT